MFFSKSIAGLCSMKTGTYVGDGSDNRNIDIGINLSVKKYAYIIIKPTGASSAIHRIEYGQGDLTMSMAAIADVENIIQGFTATGFQIGTSGYGNLNTMLYRYIVFWVN